MVRLQCLCDCCKNQCDGQEKSGLLSKGIVLYLYLNNGRKQVYSCGVFKAGGSTGLTDYTTDKVGYQTYL